MAKWNGYPPDPYRSGWWWLQHGSELICPAFWNAAEQQWEQGGLFCGGSGVPEFLTSDTFVGGVNLVGPCPEPKPELFPS